MIDATAFYRGLLYKRQKGSCNLCHQHVQFRQMHLDHIIPRSRGGGYHLGNFQGLCISCNSAKGDGMVGTWQLGFEEHLTPLPELVPGVPFAECEFCKYKWTPKSRPRCKARLDTATK